MKKLDSLLRELGACSDAKKWASGRTIEEVVETCERGDWLLWLAAKIKINKRKLFLAKGYCARTIYHLMKDERSKKAINVAILYGENKATEKELVDAADTAAAAYAAYAAADTAADAARKENLLKTADICRKYIGVEIIEKPGT